MTTVGVIVAGGLGAGLRYLAGTSVQTRLSTEFPWGTALANTIGAFVFGVIAGTGAEGAAVAIASGFVAGFTTFSTWMIETVHLWVEGRTGRVRALIDLAGLTVLGVAMAALGYEIGGLIV